MHIQRSEYSVKVKWYPEIVLCSWNGNGNIAGTEKPHFNVVPALTKHIAITHKR